MSDKESYPEIPNKPIEKWTKKQILDYYNWREAELEKIIIERQLALEDLLDAIIEEGGKIAQYSYAQRTISYYSARIDLARELQDELWSVFDVRWKPRKPKEQESK